VIVACAPPSARAHVGTTGASSLLAMLQAADGVLVARSVEATHARDATHAATPFLARETIAGEAPTGGFVLEQEAPLLRYAGLSDAILLLKRDVRASGSARWMSVQPAGAGLVLESPQVGDDTRGVLRELFAAVHPPAGGTADARRATAALVRALALPERKLRALAVLDLGALAADPQHFTAVEVDRLVRYGDAPGDDPQLAPQVREIGRLLASRRGAAEGSKGAKP
jgi:hypothetical protein